MNNSRRVNQLKEYQLELKSRLQYIFTGEEIEEEWRSMREEYALSIYSPRLDIAVGPFATREPLGLTYDRIMRRPATEEFLKQLVEFNSINIEKFGDGFVRPMELDEIKYMNHNARCFLAIEIENLVSRKHLMGGAINASALGRIGIVIPWSDEKLRAFVKLIRYLHYLRNAQKNTFDTSNLLIVTKDQMLHAIN